MGDKRTRPALLTVVIADIGPAANVGGPTTYRRVTVKLTEEQREALATRHQWESWGTTFLETETGPQCEKYEGGCRNKINFIDWCRPCLEHFYANENAEEA